MDDHLASGLFTLTTTWATLRVRMKKATSANHWEMSPDAQTVSDKRVFFSLRGDRNNPAQHSFDWSLQSLSLLLQVRHLCWLKGNHVDYLRHRRYH